MILNDKEIIELCQKGMITPFEVRQVKKENNEKVISYGVSSFGYDIRISDTFELFHDGDEPLDVKNPDSLKTKKFTAKDYFDIPAGDMVLCHSLEKFDIPDDIMCIAVGKSTYARIGCICNITPLEAGWKGYLVIELSNTTKRPIRIYPFEGIAQLIFMQGNRPLTTYADRKGKYQNQTGVQGALV